MSPGDKEHVLILVCWLAFAMAALAIPVGLLGLL